jgi:hypothetical protein
MKCKKHILSVLILVVALLATTSVVSAKATRIYFTGSEWCDPNTLIIGKEWPAGPNYQIRQITQTCYDTASITQLTGTDYLYDARINLVGGGPNFILSGKLQMVSDEGGVWNGSWTLPANTTIIKVIAHGEGKYKGQQLHWFLDLAGPFSGYIEETGN